MTLSRTEKRMDWHTNWQTETVVPHLCTPGNDRAILWLPWVVTGKNKFWLEILLNQSKTFVWTHQLQISQFSPRSIYLSNFYLYIYLYLFINLSIHLSIYLYIYICLYRSILSPNYFSFCSLDMPSYLYFVFLFLYLSV